MVVCLILVVLCCYRLFVMLSYVSISMRKAEDLWVSTLVVLLLVLWHTNEIWYCDGIETAEGLKYVSPMAGEKKGQLNPWSSVTQYIRC